MHLPIPGGLVVTENGDVLLGFADNGPGEISIELHGALIQDQTKVVPLGFA